MGLLLAQGKRRLRDHLIMGHVRRVAEDGYMTVFYCGRHGCMWHVLASVYKSRVKWMVVGERDVRGVGPSL